MTWVFILLVVAASAAGDVVLARGMKSMGDLDALRRQSGVLAVALRVMRAPAFLAGLLCHAIAFFSLMAAFSMADLSLVGPATAALTFVAATVAAKFYLKEEVDARRWVAVACVVAGVVLLTR